MHASPRPPSALVTATGHKVLEVPSPQQVRLLPMGERGEAVAEAVSLFDSADVAFRATDRRWAVRHRGMPREMNPWCEHVSTHRVLHLRPEELWMSGYTPLRVLPAAS